jgi:anti-sigma regulatory factor (Ser/Thr protein kinase)
MLTEPVTVPAGKEMDFPYPSHALGISFLTLAAVPAAVGCSRELVRLGLGRWGLAALVADAELVVSELATNAVSATGPAGTEASRGEAEDVPAIHVRLLLFEASIVIEVWDGDLAVPMPRDVAGEQISGRGLAIVAALSTKWSWFATPQGGKVVWAELAIPQRPLTEAGLPQRSRPGVATAGNQGAIRDLDLLRRVRGGLQNL